MENAHKIKQETIKEVIAKFKVDMTRKDPIQVSFWHVGTQEVTHGQYYGRSEVCGMEFMQVIWIDKQMNRCTVATSVQPHNILLME